MNLINLLVARVRAILKYSTGTQSSTQQSLHGVMRDRHLRVPVALRSLSSMDVYVFVGKRCGDRVHQDLFGAREEKDLNLRASLWLFHKARMLSSHLLTCLSST